MTCSYPDCENKPERSGKCATHARLDRKSLTDSQKAEQKNAAKPKRIDKVGTKNTFETSLGMRINQEFINDMKRAVYELYDERHEHRCEGCGNQSQAHAHIIPQARCKQINKTELIWDVDNIFMACHKCNAIAENVSSIGITKLKNLQLIKSFLELHDPERFSKLCYTENKPHKL